MTAEVIGSIVIVLVLVRVALLVRGPKRKETK